MNALNISPSQVARWNSCPRSWLYGRHYRTLDEPGNFAIGRALHDGIQQFLLGQAWGIKVDAEAAMLQSLNKSLYKPLDWEVEMLTRLLAGFDEWWDSNDYEIIWHYGVPMIEMWMSMTLPNNVELRGVVDAILWHPEKGICVFDWKTARSRSPDWFATVAPQLTAYQVLAEHYLKKRIDRLSFLEMRKTKVKKVPPTHIESDRHSKEKRQNLFQQIQLMAISVRAGHFPANVGMAWNSPCKMCDFRQLCHEGSLLGLKKKRPKGLPPAAMRL